MCLNRPEVKSRCTFRICQLLSSDDRPARFSWWKREFAKAGWWETPASSPQRHRHVLDGKSPPVRPALPSFPTRPVLPGARLARYGSSQPRGREALNGCSIPGITSMYSRCCVCPPDRLTTWTTPRRTEEQSSSLACLLARGLRTRRAES